MYKLAVIEYNLASCPEFQLMLIVNDARHLVDGDVMGVLWFYDSTKGIFCATNSLSMGCQTWI